MSQSDREGYKGYLLLLNPFTGIWYISKDGTHISSAESFERAKQIVNELMERPA